jgi:hypothetical protein
MPTIIKVIKGEETGMVGELINRIDNVVIVKATDGALYSILEENIRIIKDDTLDEMYDNLVVPSILEEIERNHYDWEANIDLMMDLAEKQIIQPEDI